MDSIQYIQKLQHEKIEDKKRIEVLEKALFMAYEPSWGANDNEIKEYYDDFNKQSEKELEAER